MIATPAAPQPRPVAYDVADAGEVAHDKTHEAGTAIPAAHFDRT